MKNTSREFQVFAKPAGPACNLRCSYCYYLEKEELYLPGESFRMSGDILGKYIIQHIAASTEPVISFSWHGGEPALAGLDFFQKVVALQKKHCPPDRQITNGIQTNGTLLDEGWCRFLASEGFAVGISLDGPEEFHDRYRRTRNKKSTFPKVIRGYNLLRRQGLSPEILCVVNADNVQHPLEIYRFFKQLDARFITFLPMVKRLPGPGRDVNSLTVPPGLFGRFLSVIFDEWKERDIGRVKVQIFEEALRTAFRQDHTLCIFKKTCGGVPVVEHNGDFYSCDHYVDREHYLGNILETPLANLLDSQEQKAFGQAKWITLPSCCHACEVLEMCNGECPKNRFIRTPEGEGGLNYLCAGYKEFFTHCRPFISAIAAVWQKEQENSIVPSGGLTDKTGRNDPCPCGSGKKYKNCCLKLTG